MAEQKTSRLATLAYLIIALFIALIFGLVWLFQFQMNAAVAMRFYAGAEGLLAKAQKDAVLGLEHYIDSRDEADFQTYQRWIAVPLGDQRARLELQKPQPDLALVRANYLQGGNHPDDIEYAVDFFLRFQHAPQWAHVIEHWAHTDRLIFELDSVAQALHAEISTGPAAPEKIRALHVKLAAINREASQAEEEFFAELSNASRWAHDASKKLTYALAFLFALMGFTLSWPIATRIHRTEGALLESEGRLHGVIDAAVDGILVADAATSQFVMCNRGMGGMLGYTADELCRLGVADIHPSEALPEVRRQFERLKKGELKTARDLPVKRRDGSVFYADISGAAMLFAGQPAMVGVFHDVTERRQAEEAIRAQQKMTTLIIETIPLRVFWKDRDSRFQGCNTLFALDAGLSRPEDLIGKTDFEMVWKDQAELYRADDLRVMDSNAPVLSYDEPQTTPDGKQIWLRTSKVPLRDEANKPIGVLGVYEDITGYKQAEQALHDSEERFRSISASAQDAIIMLDNTGRITYWNDAAEKIFGFEREAVLGQEISALLMPERFREALRQGFGQFRTSGGGAVIGKTVELAALRKNGEEFPVELSISAVRLADQWCAVGMVRDISKRKQMEESLRKLNEELEQQVQERTRQLTDAQAELVRREKLAMLGQIAASVGHELRNPLGVMNNAVYFLETVLAGADETTREYLDIIKDEIAGSERIVSGLLDAICIRAPHPQRVNLSELVAQALRKFNIPPAIHVSVAIPATLPSLLADAQQLHQALCNLIDNSVQAMPQGGELEIRARENPAEGNIALSVRDTGGGIAPEILSKLFQPLTSTKARGIGLGLVAVKNLIEANGGTVSVESTPDKGTVFTVVLPAGRGEQSGA